MSTSGELKQVERVFADDTQMPILFCDVIRGAVTQDGVVATLYQTHLGEDAAEGKPLCKVFLSWAHVEQTKRWLEGLLEKRDDVAEVVKK